jgi:hypothetical protein
MEISLLRISIILRQKSICKKGVNTKKNRESTTSIIKYQILNPSRSFSNSQTIKLKSRLNLKENNLNKGSLTLGKMIPLRKISFWGK